MACEIGKPERFRVDDEQPEDAVAFLEEAGQHDVGPEADDLVEAKPQNQHQPAAALDETVIAAASVLYLEGYLFDAEAARRAFAKAALCYVQTDDERRIVERHGFVWVWPGDAALADPAKIHDCPWADSPDWAYGGGLYHIACDYRLMIDNLMDLTHETYVHQGSIGQPEIDETPCETKVEGDQVILQRHMHGIQAPPFWQMAMSANGLDPQAKVDRWQICRFTPPSHIMIDVGVALAGKGGFNAAPEHKAYSVVVDFITPETETTMWYFWGMARRFKPRAGASPAIVDLTPGRGGTRVPGDELAAVHGCGDQAEPLPLGAGVHRADQRHHRHQRPAHQLAGRSGAGLRPVRFPEHHSCGASGH